MYLIHAENAKGERIGAMIPDPKNWSSDDYGECQRRFCDQYGKPGEYADMVRLWEKTPNGLWFDAELVSSEGVGIDLFVLPEQNREQTTKAAHHLRRQRDVVYLRKMKVHELVEWEWEPGCTCGTPCVGPVGNYCRIHDGDYSDWLVFNNID